MEMDSKTEAVIAKVRKLLAMANGTANENEAAVAAAKAQELLEAYNLDMAVVNKAEHKFAPRSKEHKAGGLYKWQRNLWYATATLNFCVYHYMKGNRAGSQYEHQVIGSHVNVVGTEIMAKYLEHTIERLARHWVNENRPGKSVFIKEAIAYREGIAQRLAERLWAERRKHLDEQDRKRAEERERNRAMGVDTENALVLQDVINTEEDLNVDYMNGWEPGTAAKRRAEREARAEAAEAAAAELLRKQDEWDAAHPEEAAKRKRREAMENERKYNEWARKANSQRYRKVTPEEQRRQLGSFSEGYREGDKISLNKQVDKKTQGRIG